MVHNKFGSYEEKEAGDKSKKREREHKKRHM